MNDAPTKWHRPDWYDDAVCRTYDPAIFYPERYESALAAKNICCTCPVRTQCLEHAMTAPEPYGVWGGLSAEQRRVLRRVRNNSPEINHGTISGYQQHYHRNEPACHACRSARAEYKRARRAEGKTA